MGLRKTWETEGLQRELGRPQKEVGGLQRELQREPHKEIGGPKRELRGNGERQRNWSDSLYVVAPNIIVRTCSLWGRSLY